MISHLICNYSHCTFGTSIIVRNMASVLLAVRQLDCFVTILPDVLMRCQEVLGLSY
jgi:hypothetical protein